MTVLRGHFTMVLSEPALPAADGPIYTLRVHGSDRPGIVAEITRVVARHGANIVDLGARLGAGLYVLTAKLQLPSEASAAGLGADLRSAADELGVAVHLAPIDDDVL